MYLIYFITSTLKDICVTKLVTSCDQVLETNNFSSVSNEPSESIVHDLGCIEIIQREEVCI